MGEVRSTVQEGGRCPSGKLRASTYEEGREMRCGYVVENVNEKS